jgi:hypothetical protein
MPVRDALGGGFAGNTSRTSSDVDDLFDTRPSTPTRPAQPVQVSSEFRMQLIGRIQEVMREHGGNPPGMDAAQEAKLRQAVARGDVVEVRLRGGAMGQQGLSVYLKKSDDLESSKTFILKTSGGFAGEDLSGPFDL